MAGSTSLPPLENAERAEKLHSGSGGVLPLTANDQVICAGVPSSIATPPPKPAAGRMVNGTTTWIVRKNAWYQVRGRAHHLAPLAPQPGAARSRAGPVPGIRRERTGNHRRGRTV